jgi:hypothetical protein
MNIKIVTNKEEVFILLCTDGCCLSCLLNYGSRIPCVWSHPSYTIWEVCVLCELQSVNVHALDYELNFFLNAYISYLYWAVLLPVSSLTVASAFMWLQIVLIVTMKISSFSNVASCRYHCFGKTCFLLYRDSWMILAKHAWNLCDDDCALGSDYSRCFKASPKYWYRCEITLCHISDENIFRLHTFILGVSDRIMYTFMGHFPHLPILPKVFPFVHVT